jgi:hypothetical protein
MQAKHLAGHIILILQSDPHEAEMISEKLTCSGATVHAGCRQH